MHSIELSAKELTLIILALDNYVETLRNDEVDPGPSMADSMFAAHLASKLRELKE